jgi:hypothetical protein
VAVEPFSPGPAHAVSPHGQGDEADDTQGGCYGAAAKTFHADQSTYIGPSTAGMHEGDERVWPVGDAQRPVNCVTLSLGSAA